MSGPSFSNGDRQPTLSSPVSNGSAGGFQLGYRPILDGIRGWALLFVLATHSGLTVAWLGLPDSISAALESIGIRNDKLLIPGGWIGLDSFFVLSGFLITVLLVKEWERTGSINFKHFYLRRVLRLMPAVLLMLLTVYLFTRFYLPRTQMKITRQGITSVLLYYSNLRIIKQTALPNDVLLHTWSLSVEEQFYFLWPITLWLMLWLRLRRRTIALILIGASVAAILARALTWAGPWHGTCLPLMSLPTRLDAILIGCLTGLLACWNLLPQSRWGRRLLHGAACLSVLYLGWVCTHVINTVDRYYYFDCTASAVCTTVLLASLVSAPPRIFLRVFEFPPLVWLGRISYGVYLWHYPLGMFLVPILLDSPALEPWFVVPPVAFVYVFTVGVAAVSFYLMERPILRLKRHFEHKAETPKVSRKLAA